MQQAVVEAEPVALVRAAVLADDGRAFGRGLLLGILLGAPGWVLVALAADAVLY